MMMTTMMMMMWLCVVACVDGNCDICDASVCYACKAGYVKNTNGLCLCKSPHDGRG